MKKIAWGVIVFLAILVSLLPLMYINADTEVGFLELKEDEVLQNVVWQGSFYTHIISGGIAILIGWVQFSKKILNRYRQIHRFIGKIYVISGLFCGLSGVIIGFYAYGGPIAQTGFMTVGCIYFYTTLMGYLRIRNKDIVGHQTMMIYSYAVCLAAITLRLYSPLLTIALDDYTTAYRIVAWLSWVPNLFIARQVARRWATNGVSVAM
jgi:hypothetical protein